MLFNIKSRSMISVHWAPNGDVNSEVDLTEESAKKILNDLCEVFGEDWVHNIVDNP